MTKIVIKSWPNDKPTIANNLIVQEWEISDLKLSRKTVEEQQDYHRKFSAWFGIFLDGKFVFDSNRIHGRKYVSGTNQLNLF